MSGQTLLHRWFRNGNVTVFLLVIIFSAEDSTAVDNLRLAFRWKFLDYDWPDENTRNLFSHYKRESHNPLAIEVAGNRLFITVPRWQRGVAASLNYVYLNDTSESPLLYPYPSWEAHRYGPSGQVPEIISPFRVWADRCDRLWVLDIGREDIYADWELQSPSTLIVYDLKTDQLLRRFTIPQKYDPDWAEFGNIVVEDESCDDSYAYLADLGSPKMLVYSWSLNTTWAVHHHYFHAEPQSGDFFYDDTYFQWWDGVSGMALAPEKDGFSTLYFHPLCSTTQYSVNTRLLRDPQRANLPENFYEFKVLGSRGRNGQSTYSRLDQTTGILFQVQTFKNLISCWKPGTEYNQTNLGIVHADNVTLNFPTHITIDRDNIWVISNRLPKFLFAELNLEEYNFHVVTGSVREAIKETGCSMES